MKEKILAAVLALFLGELGIHWFYLNDQQKGKKYLIWFIVGVLTSWLAIGLIPLIVLGIIAFVDCFKILFMTDEEFDEMYNSSSRHKTMYD